jgi:hypothetical protein
MPRSSAREIGINLMPDARGTEKLTEKAAPNALAITSETLAPLYTRERETLVALLSK